MKHRIIILVLTAFALQPVYLHAADEGSKKIPELSKEERITKAAKFEKMAEAHKHMAECLRSDKGPFSSPAKTERSNPRPISNNRRKRTSTPSESDGVLYRKLLE